MIDYCIPGTDVPVKDLELHKIIQAVGGKLIIKELPYFPPVDCTQDGCDDFAGYLILMLQNGEAEVAMCTLCPSHLRTLLVLHELDIPIRILH
jgi:hypothetical protein